MSLKQVTSTFLSRQVRLNTAAGRTGRAVILPAINLPPKISVIRKIGNLTKLAAQKKNDGGILDFLWNKGKDFLGWIGANAFKFLSFSATSIWSWVTSGINTLKSFDWNASDKALQQGVESANVQIAGIWGGLVGQGIGWLAGIGVGYGISFLCPVIGGAGLAKLVASKTSLEALEELSSSLAVAVRQTVAILGKNLLTQGYINYRKMLKNAPRSLLVAIYGLDGADFIQKVWGREGGPNMSFNYQMDQAVDSISNKALQAFIEEMLEESWDSFMEAGFVVAAEIDGAYSQYKQASQAALGSARSVEIELNKETDNTEQLRFINTPQQLLMPAVQSTINTYRLVHNRDVGLLVGSPLDEYIKGKPQSLRLVINMFSRKEPPFYRGAQKDVRCVDITIPDVKRSKLDWEVIKRCVGGADGYLWGNFKANATLTGGRVLRVFAATEKEAEYRVKALLELTDAEMLTLSITEEKKVGARLKQPKLFKEATRIYPGYFTVINREELLNPGGRATKTQNYRDKKARIPLWVTKEPPNCQRLISNLLRKGF